MRAPHAPRRGIAPLLAAAALALGAAGGCGSGAGGAGGLPDPGAGSGASYGVPVDGFPGPAERAIEVLTNAVRMAPLDYRARYAADVTPSLAAAGVLGAYPSVKPLRWNLGLARSARAHSVDMATTPCFQHDSCDGTSIWTRIRSYYGLSGTLGENIAAGYPDARAVVNAWLCDASGGSCCPDGQACDGHRRNIMAASFAAVGVGHAAHAGAPYGSYDTQDLGGASGLDEAPPLVDGAHLLLPSGQVTFLANWDAAAGPGAMAVVVDGARHPLALDLGAPARGSWAVTVPRGAGCRSYHFEAVDAAGATFRYPGSGELRTSGEGGCGEDFAP